jgi:putative membrane protein
MNATTTTATTTATPYTPLEVPLLRSASTGRALTFILVFSAAVVAFLFWLIYFKPTHGYSSRAIAALPALNATLNGISSVLLVSAFVAIRRRNVALHLRLMFAALISSALFFVSYVVYHHFHGDTKFLGTGVVRPVYFFVLISHIVLSVIVVPLILTSFYLSLAGRLVAHRKLSRFTFPIWLYVSITGVLIFAMLKLFSPNAGPFAG